MGACLFPLSVRGSEGLFMVNGPPSFTESAVFQRYRAAWPSAPLAGVTGHGEVEGTRRPSRPTVGLMSGFQVFC